ncbi:MAG TPA: response regulator [Candidatus Acidoferrales bacterium]|nr:response regulator [Candidatus Acidoferrales bacterium]
MAKILVADDNSNVQKTVTLALADLGIEVVAVNNGEAAVRKLRDVSPDLVLADIFMPVRNGYEVCEYVKKDSQFSHVPVVLLVGAFDPLDEREAQRVGADGILKKPFVPPDPLIAMVKMLLDRTLGERLVTVEAVAKPAAVVAARSKSSPVAAAEQPPSSTQISEEVPEEEEFRPPVERLSFGEGTRPVAFGQLLDTPVEEPEISPIDPVPDEQILTSARDASLGDPVFWKTEEPAPENPEENSQAPENVEQDLTADLPLRPWKPDEETTARNAEAAQLQPIEPLELVREEVHDAAAEPSSIIESSPIMVQDPAAQASLNVEPGKPEDLAANPLEWMASAPPPPVEEIPEPSVAWDAVASGPTEIPEQPEQIEHEHVEASIETPAVEAAAPELAVEAPVTPAVVEEPASEVVPVSLAAETSSQPEAASAPEIPDPEKTHPSLKPVIQSAEDTARSISKQDWADLTGSLQPPAAEKAEAIEEKAGAESSAAALEPATQASEPEPVAPKPESFASKLFSQGTEDTARSISKRDWAELAASLHQKRTDAGAESASSTSAVEGSAGLNSNENPFSALATDAQSAVADAQSASSNADPSASADPVLVEAVVQRILEKWRPQVVDIITKEFLRPIVQALVQREIQKR